MTTDFDASEVPPDWAFALESVGYNPDGVRSLVAGLYDGNPDDVFPVRSDVFRAFHLTKLKNVRVVILGQDPYPRRGQAHGLAFSVPGPERFPRSLKTIISNLENDPDVQFKKPSTGDLTPWANRGVLLLNTALTVAKGSPGSHAREWKDFTDAVLTVTSQEHEHLAFLLWGTHANLKAQSLPIHEPPHKLILSSHPAAWGKTNMRRFRDTHPFSEANAFLADHGSEGVNWDLGSS